MTNRYPMVDPKLEHDACGIGAVIDLKGRESHKTVEDALTMVERMAHRAGCDAAGTTGDGVGILTRIPHTLFQRWAAAEGIALGAPGTYGAGMFFLPRETETAEQARRQFGELAAGQGIPLICWREVPVRSELLGPGALGML